jgi:hypothetical protein
MAFLTQDPRLTMMALGIHGDQEIEDGVHLRWAFEPELGFPLDGFRLFVRPSRPGRSIKVDLSDVLELLFANPVRAIVSGGVTIHAEDGSFLTIKELCNQWGLAVAESPPLVVRFRPTLGAKPRVVREVTLYGITEGGWAYAEARFSGRPARCTGFVASGSPFVAMAPEDVVSSRLPLGAAPVLMAGRVPGEESGHDTGSIETEGETHPLEAIRSPRHGKPGLWERALTRRRLSQTVAGASLLALEAGIRGWRRARAESAGTVPRLGPDVRTATMATGCEPVEITLRADAIDEVLLSGDLALQAVAYTLVGEEESDAGWEPLTDPICLPIDHATGYTCPAGSLSGYELAKLRLPNPSLLPPDAPDVGDLADRLIGPSFDDLRAKLEAMLDAAPALPAHLQLEKIAADDPNDPAIYRLQTILEILLGSVDPYFARIVGLYHVDHPADGPWDYKVEATWTDGGGTLDLSWIVFGVGPQIQSPVAAPESVEAEAIPGASRVAEDGTVSRYQMDVGVTWQRPTACEVGDPARATFLYFVERTEADAPASGPYILANQRTFEEGGAPEPVPLLIAEAHAITNPFPLGYFVDRGPGYGTFHYRVLGRDLFGRTSPPSAPVAVDVQDEVAPGSPLNLLAEYVDPADPDRASSEALGWANGDTATGDPLRPAVSLRWTWSIDRQRQAPDVAEFRLYYHQGRLNAVAGSVTAVEGLGGKRFRVDTDLAPVGPDAPTAPAATDLGMLRNEGEEYWIETIETVAGALSFVVEANEASPPIPGQGTFRFGAGSSALPPYPAYREFKDPADWQGLVLDPAAPETPAPLLIGVDGAVLDPLPAGLTADDVHVERDDEIGEQGAHWHYKLLLRGLTLAPTRDRPRASGSFGITAVDDAEAANESRVSPPAGIFAIHRAPPEIPVLKYPDAVFATPADFHGNSYFTLDWPADRGVGYFVYRASDAQLLTAAGVDLAAHRQKTPPEQRLELIQLGSRRAHVEAFSTVTPEPMRAATTGTLRYRDRLDGRVLNRFVYRMRAIDRAGNLANWPADPPLEDAGEICVVVDIPDTTPPSPPIWSGSAPNDDGLALLWAPNAEPDLLGYRLYRAYDAADATDVRSMTPLLSGATPEGTGGLIAVSVQLGGDGEPTIETVELAGGDRPPGWLIRFVDTEVESARTVYFRLIAEDTAGNRSLPSELLTTRYPKRQPPSPPSWESLIVVSGRVELIWTAEEDDLECLVMRRIEGTNFWRPVGPWRLRGEYAFVDTGVTSGETYEYFVRVRDRVGHVIDGPVQSGVTVP